MIVETCCNFILSGENVKEEGIFRLPGNHLEVKKLQESYDKGDRPTFDRLARFYFKLNNFFNDYTECLLFTLSYS